MDPTAPAAASSNLVPAQAPGPAPELPSGHSHPSPLLPSQQETPGSERRAGLWRPWLPSANDKPRQVAAGGATAAEATKTDCEFHHPVRLFWPRSRSFDYLYSAGEILLQNFPVQATINLYEDSDSEDDEQDKEEDEEEEANEEESEGRVSIPVETPPSTATARSPSPSTSCPN